MPSGARIERDLHDGAQQRLVALRMHLSLVGEQIGGSAASSRASASRSTRRSTSSGTWRTASIRSCSPRPVWERR